MKTLVSTIVISLITFVTLSQEPKVVVFNQSDDDNKRTSEVKNLVKISILEPLTGDICVYYERVLGEKIAGEIGLGFTIDDYIGTLIFADEYNTNYNSRTPLIGYSLGLGFRYYPFMASEEFYFAPEFKHRYYHSEQSIGSGSDITRLNESKKFTNFRITAGYTYFFDDNIFLEYYAGVGLALFKYSEYEAIYNEVTYDYDYVLQEYKRPRPWLTLGMKFGFAF